MYFNNHNTEFYLPLPNGLIYYVTCTALNQLEIVRRLNNNVDLSNVPDHHHCSLQSLIQQQIQQKFVGHQQNDTQQETQPSSSSQAYSDNNQNPSNDNNSTHIAAPQKTFEFYFPLDMYICHVTYTELNSLEIAQLLNDAHALRYYNEQSLIQQQIQQQVQSSLSTQSIQVYSDNDTSCNSCNSADSADSTFSNTEDMQDGISVV